MLLSALLLCPLLAAAQPHLLGDPGQRNQKEGGFVLSAELGATLNLFNTVGSSRTVVPVGTPSGGLAIGFKSGRVIGTLGLDLSNATELGTALYTKYVYPFELAAVLLLVAIIAAIVLTMRHRKGLKVQDIGAQVATRREDRLRVLQMPAEKKE